MDANLHDPHPVLRDGTRETVRDDPLAPIREALDSERSLALAPPTLERVAHKLGMTERTFQRRLHQCGVTFRQLLAEQQRAWATHLLAQRKLAISEVAFALGYSEQAAFARAFRRWTGQTPRSYRRKSLGRSQAGTTSAADSGAHSALSSTGAPASRSSTPT